MRIETGFRLSTYLSLSLACLCLGEAELLFVPTIFFFVIPAILLLGAACYLEGRWTLPRWAANALGLAIAPAAAIWMTASLLKNDEGSSTPIFHTAGEALARPMLCRSNGPPAAGSFPTIPTSTSRRSGRISKWGSAIWCFTRRDRISRGS